MKNLFLDPRNECLQIGQCKIIGADVSSRPKSSSNAAQDLANVRAAC